MLMARNSVLSSDAAVEKIRRLIPASVRPKLPRRIVVVSVSRSRSRALNRAYREKDHSANVLSFRYGISYGEILLCAPMIRAEARSERQPVRKQMTRMILHAMIHLARMHHEQSPRAARRVRSIEQQIIRKLFSKDHETRVKNRE